MYERPEVSDGLVVVETLRAQLDAQEKDPTSGRRIEIKGHLSDAESALKRYQRCIEKAENELGR